MRTWLSRPKLNTLAPFLSALKIASSITLLIVSLCDSMEYYSYTQRQITFTITNKKINKKKKAYLYPVLWDNPILYGAVSEDISFDNKCFFIIPSNQPRENGNRQ